MNPRLEDEILCKIFKYHLTSKKCKNQGFILDGFPKTKAQAEILFAVDDDDAEDNEDGQLNTVAYLPELLVGLEATSPFTYFDENEVHPKMYNLEGSIDPTDIDE